MDDVVVGISKVKREVSSEEEIKRNLERIKALEEQLQKEKVHNGELRTKIGELQKEKATWQNEKKNVMDAATQTDGEEVAGQTSSPAITIPEQVESISIADSIRDAAEAAMTNSGFVYDDTSGLYYDYTSGYYYNPENRLYYDTKTGIYYYFNETTNAYEFHSQVEIPEETQPEQETEEREYRRRKQDRGSRRKNVHEKYHNNSEHVEVKNQKRKQTERRDRIEKRDRGEKRDRSKKRFKDEKETSDVRERRKDKKHRRNKYDSRSDDEARSKHRHKKKKRKNKKKRHRKDEQDAEKQIVEYVISDEEQAMMEDKIESDKTKTSRNITDDSASTREKTETNIDIVVISSGESDIEEGEIEETVNVEEAIEDVEEGEIASSPSRRSSSERSSLSDISSDSVTDMSDEEMDDRNEEEVNEEMEEEAQQVNRREYPPCIRMIVAKSESIQPGSLYIITCMGGSIGREGSEHTVVIPEVPISKKHAEIFYCQQSWQYYIRDLGSQNGTLINSKSIAEPRTESEAHILSHKDYLTIGGTVLRLHIHPGAETCDDCEPGQVQALLAQNQPKAPVTQTTDKEQQRRKDLKQIKKKYGLAKDKYVDKDPSTANSSYSDRADVRRKTVGSDNPHQKDDLPSSVNREIGSDNLGRKIMEKMGWKSGDTLGKDNTGIKEPINVLSNNKRAGLGGQAQRTINDLAQGNLASEKWDKARARYDALARPGKITMQLGSTRPKKIEMNWTSGGVMKPQCKKENIFGSDDKEEEGDEVT